jgi:hypothetical protein
MKAEYDLSKMKSRKNPYASKLRIPEQVGHQFRSNPATDSVSFRPGIPVESGH